MPHVVLGRDERREDDLLPPVRVLCLLTSRWRPEVAEGVGRAQLVGWFGDVDDPFAHLAAVLAGLSWRDHAADHRID